ncbi:NADP-dependent isocitrate dehydrogenase [Rickettsiales endosymbiont of Stachyamoeba lipophora]|uniref:NADP-dependent isocitrate dehydrogenase n=1 Tax=Rickettsiales endosymbiont of Stachyamoeba lipophora TaxID=2486578 RepID=UPI000F64BECE|nr:NADP-dependent isocitrate dehydrogenase [Rickettsiales endosymbiont of Stachyamoeba lipophora]AZL15853.1 NADP-dependent isocitrate dehydrogenase [Rickettsiales endosymbiont of Stachyamoeba lipophora]
MTKSITVAYGDGIGPEIMEAVLYILKEAKANINFETVEVGENLYTKGYKSGISDNTWESLKRTKVILKAPITTPQGGGYKSLNVTMRKTLGLFANIRPTISYAPFVATKHPEIDLVIIRENEEDLYAGIEHRQTTDMYQTLKLISRTGCEKIIRFAFEYAVKNNRHKVTCMSKDNIMKMTDGIFHKVFDEIKKDYPQLESEHYIIDIGTARIAARPNIFDVIVTSNLYGDIISDVAAEVSGSVGLAGSANIGTEYALFEAIHGSAPDIAGNNIANPSGLLHGALMMLIHIGQPKIAEKIHNAWSCTIEEGIHTADIYNQALSKQKAGTKEFAEAVVKRLGKIPHKFKPVSYPEVQPGNIRTHVSNIPTVNKQLVGSDIFIDIKNTSPDDIANKINTLADGKLRLQGISAKGLALWPKTHQMINITCDHWCLRFVPIGENKICTHQDIIELLNKLNGAQIDVIKTENLYLFDGQLGFSLSQGE